MKRNMVQLVKNLLVPPLCPTCGDLVLEDSTLCASCWQQVGFITNPLCTQCGVPFEFAAFCVKDLKCAHCLDGHCSYDMGRSVVTYNDLSKKLILPFKHADGLHIGQLMAHWSVKRCPEIFENMDYLVPVPLHWTRMLKRQYNQSALYGQYLSKLTSIKHAPTLLKRLHNTPSQGGKTRKQREDNVKNAFAINTSVNLAGRSVVVLDDVMTTGATIEACCHVLRKGGIKQINVLTFARVVKSGFIV